MRACLWYQRIVNCVFHLLEPMVHVDARESAFIELVQKIGTGIESRGVVFAFGEVFGIEEAFFGGDKSQEFDTIFFEYGAHPVHVFHVEVILAAGRFGR